jgi:CRP-like cAMP-binding protein
VINRLAETLDAAGRTVVAVNVAGHPLIGAKLASTMATFPDADVAVEWCEDQLLGVDGIGSRGASTPLADFDLLEGLDSVELASIELAVAVHVVAAGRAIFRQGDAADHLFFLVDGKVGAPRTRRAARPEPPSRHLRSGVAFGEMALLDEGAIGRRGVRRESTVARCRWRRCGSSSQYPRIGRTIGTTSRGSLLAARAAGAQIRASRVRPRRNSVARAPHRRRLTRWAISRSTLPSGRVVKAVSKRH